MNHPDPYPSPPAGSIEPAVPTAESLPSRTRGQVLLQRYELLEPIGEGGMGEVWMAHDRATGDRIALKCLTAGAAGQAEALKREFARLAALAHPNIVQVHDYGFLEDGAPYFTMELVEGPALPDALSTADLGSVLAAVEGACAGLSALHAAGLVHGDVKPANVLVAGGRVRSPGEIRLVDFGLAGKVGAGEGPRGTPGFAAPEVLDGAAPTPRSDLYGLGVTLYVALTGRSPFPGRTVGEVLRSQHERVPSPLPLRVLGVPGELEHVILRLLERDPDARPASATEVWETLQPVAARVSRAAPGQGAPALVHGSILGRDAELDLAESRLDADGPPVLVTGAPGAGRSRFLRELALRAELAGGRAVVVSCAGRSDGAREWLRRVGVVLGLERREPAWPDVLAALVGRRRVCLALEDLHLGTPGDFEIARAVLAAGIPARALVVLSWAEPVAGTTAAFEDFRAIAGGPWLEAAPLAITLAPLDIEQTRRLVRLELGGAVLPEIEQAAHRLSGGLPLWIEAALLACIEQRSLVREDGRWLVPPGAAPPASLPALETLLEARLAALSPAGRAWLATLAELGGEAASATVARVAETGPQAQAEAVDAGLAVVEPTPDAEIVRGQPLAACDLARRGLEPGQRRALAARAAEALSDHPEQAAALWIAAEQPQRALDALAGWPDEDLGPTRAWIRAQLRLHAHEQLGGLLPAHLEAAARAAEKAQRFQDAGALWERYANLEATGREDPLAAARGWLRAAVAQRGLAEHDRAASLLDECERRLSALPRPDDNAAAAVRASVLSERAWIAMIRGDLRAAEQSAQQALETAPGEALAERFTAWNRLIAIYPRMGRLEDADRALEQALRLAHEMGDEVAEGRAHANAVFMARLRGDLKAEREHLERAMAVSEKSGLLSRACRDAALIATNLSCVGTDAEAKAALARAETLARAAGDPSVLLTAITGMARVELRAGHLQKAWQLTTGTLTAARRLEDNDAIAWAWNRLGMILALRGRRRAAVRSYRRAIRLWRTTPGHGAPAYSLVNLADMAMDKGFLDTSRRLLEHAYRSARSVPAVSTWVARARARLAARTDDAAEARRALDQAPGESQVRDDAEAHGALLEASALVSCAAGDPARAIATYNQAAALYRGRGYRYHLGRCLTQAARALHEGPSPSPELALQRAEWLREARSVYEQMEAPGPLASILPDLLVLERDVARQGENLPAAEIRDTLYEVSQLLNSILDFPELIHKVLQLAVQRLRAERGLILLADPGTGELTPVARHGLMDENAQADAMQISTSIVRRVLQTGATFRSDDAAVDPRLATMKSVFDLSLRSILCAALRLRDQVIGTIYLQNRTARGAFTDADIAFLESFSNLVAVAIENSRLHENLRQANESLVDENVELRRQVPAQFKYANLIGRSREMAQLHALIDRFAQAPADVLIEGETGTGKELVARTIHYNSPRRDRPFLSINCVALPETLIEAELFGIEDHVATGVRAREGIFQRAEGGSVLLDEIGDMPPGMQARLLRVLQEREFTRVGGKRSIRMNVRVFAATNADLRERVRDNRFRADLFFRVNRLVIHIPPLRERKSDISVLARHFTQRLCEAMGRPAPRLAPALLEVMGRSNWPGNVRELENYIERLLVVCDGPVLEPRALPGDLEEAAEGAARPAVASVHGVGATTLAEALAGVERELITEAIRRSGGNRSKAARALAMAEPTLRYRMRKLGIAPAEATRED